MKTSLDRESQSVVDDYIASNDPYEKTEPFYFDLRGYWNYVKEYGLSYDDITEELAEKYVL